MIADLIAGQVTTFIAAVGYWGIFFLMALESTMIPLPSEVVMPFAGFLVASGSLSFFTVLFASTVGCLAGSLVSYYLGYRGGLPFVRKFGRFFLMDEKHLIGAEKWFAEKGEWTVFIGRFIPGVRHVISIPAGVGRMNIVSFSAFTLLGAGIWNSILIWTGYILEKNWQIVYRYTEYVDIVIVFIIFIAIVYYITRIIENRKKRN
jgi:membrane protein DedA with SNARE-associated domain